MFSPSASTTMGACVRRICDIMAMAVVSSVPRPGPIAMALKSSEGTASVNSLSSASQSTTASGTAICMMPRLSDGTCTFTFPTPERRHALVASTDAPAMP